MTAESFEAEWCCTSQSTWSIFNDFQLSMSTSSAYPPLQSLQHKSAPSLNEASSLQWTQSESLWKLKEFLDIIASQPRWFNINDLCHAQIWRKRPHLRWKSEFESNAFTSCNILCEITLNKRQVRSSLYAMTSCLIIVFISSVPHLWLWTQPHRPQKRVAFRPWCISRSLFSTALLGGSSWTDSPLM